MVRESELAAPMTARDSSVTVLHEIDLGAHHLFIMSDQSIDLLADEDAPYVADNLLSLDASETYRLLISLQEVFRQETDQSQDTRDTECLLSGERQASCSVSPAYKHDEPMVWGMTCYCVRRSKSRSTSKTPKLWNSCKPSVAGCTTGG
jgi:hypothetical protein